MIDITELTTRMDLEHIGISNAIRHMLKTGEIHNTIVSSELRQVIWCLDRVVDSDSANILSALSGKKDNFDRRSIYNNLIGTGFIKTIPSWESYVTSVSDVIGPLVGNEILDMSDHVSIEQILHTLRIIEHVRRTECNDDSYFDMYYRITSNLSAKLSNAEPGQLFNYITGNIGNLTSCQVVFTDTTFDYAANLQAVVDNPESFITPNMGMDFKSLSSSDEENPIMKVVTHVNKIDFDDSGWDSIVKTSVILGVIQVNSNLDLAECAHICALQTSAASMCSCSKSLLPQRNGMFAIRSSDLMNALKR